MSDPVYDEATQNYVAPCAVCALPVHVECEMEGFYAPFDRRDGEDYVHERCWNAEVTA